MSQEEVSENLELANLANKAMQRRRALTKAGREAKRRRLTYKGD